MPSPRSVRSRQPERYGVSSYAAGTYWVEAYAKNSHDEKAIIGNARALEAEGGKDKAFSLLQQAAIYNSDSKLIASEEGRLDLDWGQTPLAERLLTRANDPAGPDWHILNALGTIPAQRGNKPIARAYFEKAAKLAPREPSVLNNLALTYALDDDPARAEGLLRQATAAGSDTIRERQKLTLVLGIEGKLDEVQPVAATALGKDKAGAKKTFLQKCGGGDAARAR